MEAAKEHESAGLLNKIIPPRLEDAGLEDCALPPDSIKEAFFKAASAVKSRASSFFTDDEDEERQDLWPDQAKGLSDEVVGGASPETAVPDSLEGVDSGVRAPGTCTAEKGGGVGEDGGDKVVVVGDDVEEREGEKVCVNEGLKGLKIKEKRKIGTSSDEEAKDEDKEPILTEGFV